MKELGVNLGCGGVYRDGWLNVDVDRGVRADLYLDVNESSLPKSDYVWACNVLEHLKLSGICNVVGSLNVGGVLEGIVPHYLCRHAYNDVGHRIFFNVNTFDSIGGVVVDKLRVVYCVGGLFQFELPLWFVRFHERFFGGFFPPSHIWFRLVKK